MLALIELLFIIIIFRISDAIEQLIWSIQDILDYIDYRGQELDCEQGSDSA
jgi:hypothetical protein